MASIENKSSALRSMIPEHAESRIARLLSGMAWPSPHFERLPCTTVLLRHDLPDGSSHVDWLVARDPEGLQPLVSFRMDSPLDELQPGTQIIAEHIGDHRPLYLEYEGEVTGNRGRVKRLKSGKLIQAQASERDRPDSLFLQIRWGSRNPHEQHLHLARYDDDQWIITCTECVPTDMLRAHAIKEES